MKRRFFIYISIAGRKSTLHRYRFQNLLSGIRTGLRLASNDGKPFRTLPV